MKANYISNANGCNHIKCSICDSYKDLPLIKMKSSLGGNEYVCKKCYDPLSEAKESVIKGGDNND